MLDMDAFREYMNTAENFNLLNRLHVTVVQEGYCECEVTLDKWSMNPQGFAHGSLIFALCDLVTGMAGATTGRSMLTQCASISFLRPGSGTKLRARSNIIRDGRTTGLIEGEVYDDRDRLIAKGSFTIFYTGRPVVLPAPGTEGGEGVWRA